MHHLYTTPKRGKTNSSVHCKQPWQFFVASNNRMLRRLCGPRQFFVLALRPYQAGNLRSYGAKPEMAPT